MSTETVHDERAQELRDQSPPLAGMAGILALDGARTANVAFNQALRGRPNAEQAWLRSREMARLNAFATRLRGRDGLSVEEALRQLRGLKHQLQRILVA